jgi:hypothetical protein
VAHPGLALLDLQPVLEEVEDRLGEVLHLLDDPAALDVRRLLRLPANDDMVAVAIGEAADLGGDLMLVIVAVEQVREGDGGQGAEP